MAISREDRVVVGNQDLYYPEDYDEEDATFEFDWEREPNRRDKLLRSFFENGTKEFLVETVRVGAAGSVQIFLNGGFCLDILPCDSLSHEHWRLFEPDKDEREPHFVVSGKGVET